MPDSVTTDIKQALLVMLGERDIRRVTMKDIAERAHVSRGTLYLYYEDKYAILEDIAEEMKDGLSEALYDSLKHKDVLHLNGGWQKVHPTTQWHTCIKSGNECTYPVRSVRNLHSPVTKAHHAGIHL